MLVKPKPGVTREEVDRIWIEQALPLLQSLPGLRHVYVLWDGDRGSGVVQLWESEAALQGWDRSATKDEEIALFADLVESWEGGGDYEVTIER